MKQSLQQKLLQKLSPQQIQFIRLLQVPTAALEARIKEELEENPALLDEANPEENSETPVAKNNNPEQVNTDPIDNDSDGGEGPMDNQSQEVSFDEFYKENTSDPHYDYRSYLPEDPNDEEYESPMVQLNSLYDSLMQQIGLLDLTEHQELVAEQIIGSIDEDGYFRRPIETLSDELAFRLNIETTIEEVEYVLVKIQQLEPAGVGARDLRECLLIQLDRKTATKQIQLAKQILTTYYEDFTKKHFDRITSKLKLTNTQFKDAYNFIIKLNPKPGESQTEVKHQYIIPDFILSVDNGKIEIKLNRKNAPELHVNQSYFKMLKDLESKPQTNPEIKETILFVKAKIEAAKWFIDAIKQRQDTLLNTMNAIASKQKEFFISEGDETYLKPMILKDVADKVNLDISTISRVANSKYVQTDFGIFLLKYFFSEAITKEDGEEVSNKEVKKILKDLVDNEEKNRPLSDDRLAEILNERGYNIARRTVAKYREQLNISVARLRKEL